MGLEYDFIVLDFGLVKIQTESRVDAAVIHDAQIIGSRNASVQSRRKSFSAKERSTGAPTLFALGCVAWWPTFLTGQLVFEADTPMKMLMQHVQAVPLPPSKRTELPNPTGARCDRAGMPAEGPEQVGQKAGELLGIARNCRTCEGWTQASARSWWERHLPELTGPLTLGDDGPRAPAASAAAIRLAPRTP